MPERTPEEAELINSLPVKTSDTKCNARCPTGYCQLPAGFKTDHLGKGRCHLHGGRAGRPIVSGLYSKRLGSDLKTEFEKLVNDPQLVDLYAELAFAKTMMSNFIDSISERLDNGENIWVGSDRHGTEIVAPQAKILLQLIETLSKVYTRIVDAETKSKNTLNVKQVHMIITQIKNSMNSCCGECPVRFALAEKLTQVRTPAMGE